MKRVYPWRILLYPLGFATPQDLRKAIILSLPMINDDRLLFLDLHAPTKERATVRAVSIIRAINAYSTVKYDYILL